MVSVRLGSKPDSFQLQGQKWVCPSGLPSDIIVEVGDFYFHLHKFPLLSRSGLMEKMIAEFHAEEGAPCMLHLHDIPGGAKAFELIFKFCYGVRIELNASNAVSIRCAAEHLIMTEDYGEANLIDQTENFLKEVFSNWKDSIQALETCEDVLPQAEELGIVTRCINSLAIKACADQTIFKQTKTSRSTALWNGIEAETHKTRCLKEGWWHEDVSFLNLPFYKRLLSALEAKGMKPEGIAGALIFYAKRHLPGMTRHSTVVDSAKPTSLTELDQRSLLEEIVSLLPEKKSVAPAKFLLCLLRTAMILQASAACRETLEKKAGAQLEEAGLEDILIPCMGSSAETLYDVDCVQRMLDHFLFVEQTALASSSPGIFDDGHVISNSPSLAALTSVAKLMDAYLAEVAPDANLKPPKFQSLASAVPDYARPLDDGLYRAIDIYFEAHPWLTDSEREKLCRLMNTQKLSLEACAHAAQNERLPLRVIVQVLFFEQLRLRTSIAGWFFVSDSLENSHAAQQGRLPAAIGGKNDDRPSLTDVSEGEEGGQSVADDGEMRLRLSELEKECVSIKQEIDKLGKPKTHAWNIFPKNFGL
ncbi:phototropic-responsive NPH3 family protein [Wolffia australiana]